MAWRFLAIIAFAVLAGCAAHIEDVRRAPDEAKSLLKPGNSVTAGRPSLVDRHPSETVVKASVPPVLSVFPVKVSPLDDLPDKDVTGIQESADSLDPAVKPEPKVPVARSAEPASSSPDTSQEVLRELRKYGMWGTNKLTEKEDYSNN